SVSGVVPASADVVVPAEAGVYTAAAAPTKMVGAAAYTWGRFPTSGSVRAWTEVKVGGVWSRSQVVSTDATGYYVIPLTYGANTAGTYTFRVRGELPGGVVSTQEFTVRRLAKPTVTSAGAKLVGLTTYVWGRVDGAGGGRVWTEVFAGGRWVRSQVGQTSSSGSYTLPLTYGASTRGTYSFRVRAEYPDGMVATSRHFTLRRLGSPTVSHAASKYVGDVTYAWGQFDTPGALRVWTEVFAGGRWVQSRVGQTSSSGSYTLPLTYGASTPGTYAFRVRGQYGDGSVATTREFNLQRIARVTKAQQAVAFARAQIGDSYGYGATGPNAWDCSGLTGGAWKAAGVNLPRTTYQQYAAYPKVAKSALQPGDLVFYYSARSHVGIYVGGGQIVHSSRPGTPVQQVSVNLMPYNGAVRPA
ncbi:C40 family peptidase, partial [Microlunatus sp. Y2014]|uniref:C40 family peptidase n=1 Tax=Microlunatus sp. Y2014 TaxID=3418488 RepID=UPI003B49D71F